MTTKYPNTIAIGVIFVGVLIIMLVMDQRDDCSIHLENLKKTLQVDLYSQNLKTMALPPRLRGALLNCRQGNSSGACLDASQIGLKLLQAVNRVPASCAPSLTQEVTIKSALIELMKLYIEIAWGEHPPEKSSQIGEGTWLEYSDYALFCNLKKTFIRIYGKNLFFESEAFLLQNLPGEKVVLEDGKCLNCEYRKPAIQVLGMVELKKRTLLGVNCSRF